MSQSSYIRFRPNGIVEEVDEVVSKQTTIKDYLDKLRQSLPKDIATPVLPAGTIRYFQGQTATRDASRSHSSAVTPAGSSEFVTMFFPSNVRTISYRDKASNRDEDLKFFKIAFPHMLIRFQFINQLVVSMYLGVVKKRPEHLQEAVYHMLMPNTWEDSKVCIQLTGTAGDLTRTCEDNIELFFNGSPFNKDLQVFPPGVSSFDDWQNKTTAGSRFILEKEWPYQGTLKDFTEGGVVRRAPR